MQLRGPLLLIGGGRMGAALLDGWLARGLPPADVVVVEPEAGRAAELGRLGVTVHGSAMALPEGLSPRILVLAVKPQVMPTVLDELHARLVAPELVVSIAAGKPLAVFEHTFGTSVPVVRVMPNTPAAIGRGISALFANPAAGKADRELAEALMLAVGEIVWLASEDEMHAVTALSGGGPAYVFLLVEAMAVAGERLGLDADLAMRLARKTVAGAGALLDSTDTTPASLRQAVTSPGGTTKAALEVLMSAGDEADDEEEPMSLAELMTEALAAAAERSRELG
jgi:pyrroline-5-carboxylate reductase